MSASHSPFVVSLVCTGNLCRSPLAQHLLEARVGDLPSITITSGGTAAAVGLPVPGEIVKSGLRHGVDVSDHHPRAFTDDDLAGSDLVLALGREHRRAIVQMQPRASRRTFTLLEFSLLADSITDDDLLPVAELGRGEIGARLERAVGVVASLRGHLPVTDISDVWDITDPYRGTRADYDRAADRIADASDQTARLLARALAV